MQELGPGSIPEIGEEQLAESQPRVRALLVKRYEEIWGRVEVRIQEDRDHDRPLDPRILEIGLRVLKDEAVLYRLGRQAAVVEEEEDPAITGVDRAALVAQQLAELEERQREGAQRLAEYQERRKEERDAQETVA